MKHKQLIILSILLAGMVGIAIYNAFQYYGPPQLKEPYQLSGLEDDTIRIAYIGDSWAFMHKDHDCLIPKLLSDTLHYPVKVHFYGICGLTSKEIYENIFNNNDFRHFLHKRHYHYCFISAGINDTYKKMSTSYYQQSMDGIIQFFLANHIRPIILEIPDYDIEKCFERQKLPRKILRRLSMIVNQTPIDCKQRFRDALDNLKHHHGYDNQIIILRYQLWNDKYEQDLKTLYLSDGLHLNNKGYERLDSVITNQIIKYKSNIESLPE